MTGGQFQATRVGAETKDSHPIDPLSFSCGYMKEGVIMKVEDIIKLTEAGYTKADVAELLKAEEPEKEEPKKEEPEKAEPEDLKTENEKLKKQIEELQKANRKKELPEESEEDSDGLIKRLFG